MSFIQIIKSLETDNATSVNFNQSSHYKILKVKKSFLLKRHHIDILIFDKENVEKSLDQIQAELTSGHIKNRLSASIIAYSTLEPDEFEFIFKSKKYKKRKMPLGYITLNSVTFTYQKRADIMKKVIEGRLKFLLSEIAKITIDNWSAQIERSFQIEIRQLLNVMFAVIKSK